MNPRSARRLLAVVAVALLAASCAGNDRGGDADPETTAGGQIVAAGEASDAGVGEGAITIGIISGDVEKLVQLGFASHVGDPRGLYESFLVSANASGGINGRRVDWVYEEFDLVDGDEAMQAACQRLFERATPLVVVTSAGFVDAIDCVTVEHDTPVVAAETFAASQFAASNDNLFTIPATSQVAVASAIDVLEARGDLEGRTIGVLYGDRQGMAETVATGLVPALERNGLSLAAKAQLTGASSEPGTFSQYGEAIATLQGAGVDTLVMLHDAFLATNFMTAAARAGYTPKLIGTDYQHIADPTVLPFIENYDAAAAFDGMLGVTYTRTGDDTSGAPDPIDQGCSSRYDTARGPDSPDDATQRRAQRALICNQMEIVLRSLRQAGENPTHDSFRAALTSLPSIHLGFGGQGSFGESKGDAADEFRVVEYQAETKSFVPLDGYAPASR